MIASKNFSQAGREDGYVAVVSAQSTGLTLRLDAEIAPIVLSARGLGLPSRAR